MTKSAIAKILQNYESDNPGTKANLVRMLMAGKLAGTGKLIVLPVDQGFEHGPIRSFDINQDAYDPHYHFKLAIDAGLSAYAAPLGMLEAGADTFAGQIPLILKLNSSNSLLGSQFIPDQAITGSIQDALRLGCSAVGLTIYPGSDNSLDMFEEAREIIEEAKDCGLATVVWSYARGGNLNKKDETALDTIAYAAHIAALLGANIIKVKPPTADISNEANLKALKTDPAAFASMSERIKLVMRCCFNGRRMVLFSGGESKDLESIYSETKAIHQGGGTGSIIGRNTFQRPRADALAMLEQITAIYKA